MAKDSSNLQAELARFEAEIQSLDNQATSSTYSAGFQNAQVPANPPQPTGAPHTFRPHMRPPPPRGQPQWYPQQQPNIPHRPALPVRPRPALQVLHREGQPMPVVPMPYGAAPGHARPAMAQTTTYPQQVGSRAYDSTQSTHQAQHVYAAAPQTTTIAPQTTTAAPGGAAASAENGKGGGEGKGKEKKKGVLRKAGGETWRDETLDEWPEHDFRMFVGDLGNEVNDELLTKAFCKYGSVQKAKVVRDKRTSKSRGYGFVSFADGADYSRALKEMNGKYVGNRPVKLKKSSWLDRSVVPKKKQKKK